MSLEDLRAQAEAEDNEVEQPEAEEPEQEEADEPETEQEETEEPEAEEAEESDDFELELEGDSTPDQQNKPDAVEVLQHKLSRKNRQKKRAEEERDSLKEELEQIKAMLRGGHQAYQPQQPAPQAHPQSQPGVNYPPVPLLYEGYNGKTLTTYEEYNVAYQDWMRRCREVDQRHSEAEKAQNQNREQFESMTKQLAERAAKFASENKVKVDVVADALDKATSEIDQATGIDGALAFLLDSVGDGSERVAYYIGTNANAMGKVKALLQQDPKGFKAIAEMTRMVERLKPKHSRKISKAPEPDQPLRGDGSKSGALEQKLQDRWDKASSIDELHKIRKEAAKVGYKLKTK